MIWNFSSLEPSCFALGFSKKMLNFMKLVHTRHLSQLTERSFHEQIQRDYRCNRTRLYHRFGCARSREHHCFFKNRWINPAKTIRLCQALGGLPDLLPIFLLFRQNIPNSLRSLELFLSAFLYTARSFNSFFGCFFSRPFSRLFGSFFCFCFGFFSHLKKLQLELRAKP